MLNACFMIMERTSPSWVALSRDGEMGRDPVLPSKASLPTGEQMPGVKGAGSPEKPVVAGGLLFTSHQLQTRQAKQLLFWGSFQKS